MHLLRFLFSTVREDHHSGSPSPPPAPPQPLVSWSGEFLIVSPLLEFLVSSLECLGKTQLQRGGCCYSVVKWWATICDPKDCSTPGFPVLHQSLFKLTPIESVMPSNHLILFFPLLLPSSIFPSIRVFSSESTLCIRWLKYWSFSFSISPSND